MWLLVDVVSSGHSSMHVGGRVYICMFAGCVFEWGLFPASSQMWEMYQRRSGAWQMRFHTISNAGYSPASMHRLLNQYPEGAPPVAEGHVEAYDDLDTCESGPVQYTANPKYQSRLITHRYSTNGILPHLVPRPSESVPRCFPRGTEECGSSPGLPRLGRRFSYQCHPYDEGWQRKRTCGHHGSYSPPRRRCGRSESHLRQMHQQGSGQPVGSELKPMRRPWQDVEVPLNTSTSVTIDSSTESAPSPTQSHGESTMNQSISSEEVSHAYPYMSMPHRGCIRRIDF